MEFEMVGLLGLVAESSGLIAGILILYFFQLKSGKNMGMLYGATSGLMLAMICFDILPEALDKGRIDLVFCGIIIGMLLGILLDDMVPVLEIKCEKYFSQSIGKTGLILAFGIAMHNVPEGFALGAMGHASVESISRFTLILALHSIPEGIALAIPFKKAGTPIRVLLIIGTCLGSMMGVGAVLGYILSGVHENLISTGLGLAAGIILYIVCGDLMPESRKIWNGRWTTIATIIGLMCGILLLYN